MTTEARPFAPTDRKRPLEGLKILDVTWFGAGPIAVRIMANLGATVVRIETEKRPDGLRIAGPKPVGNASLNVSGYYNNFNTEKLSIAIDLTMPEGHALGMKLAQWADIFMTNMTNRAVRQTGLTWEQVSGANPGIIGLYEPMQGLTGPHTEYMGFGAVLSALCGLNYQAGYEQNRPIGVGSNYPDYVVNPGHGIIAMMAALRHKRRTGEGQLIDMSQLESSAAVLSGPVFALDNADIEHVRQGNRVPYAAPHGAYKTLDTETRPDLWIAIACLTDDQWQALATAIGQPEFATEARFATLEARKANEDALDAALATWAATQPGDDALRVLQAAHVPAGLVLNATEVLNDPHLTERSYYAYPPHAEAGVRAYDGPGFRLSKTPNEVRGAAPLLGEHTFQVATEILGLEADEVGRLIAEGVLQ